MCGSFHDINLFYFSEYLITIWYFVFETPTIEPNGICSLFGFAVIRIEYIPAGKSSFIKLNVKLHFIWAEQTEERQKMKKKDELQFNRQPRQLEFHWDIFLAFFFGGHWTESDRRRI